MIRLETIAICLAIALTYNFVECSGDVQSESNIEVAVVQNLTKFLEENPKVKLLEKLEKESATSRSSTRLQLSYKVGSRISGNEKNLENISLLLIILFTL